MFRSYKWASLIMLNVGLAPIGGLLALVVTGTYLSVASGIGMLALFGVSVQTGASSWRRIHQPTESGAVLTSSMPRWRELPCGFDRS